MTKHFELMVFVLLGLLTIQLAACTPANNTTDVELEIEQTLQAIYAENTAQAMDASMNAVEEPPAPPPAQPAEPSLMPADPPDPVRTLADFDSSLRANEHRTISGDRFLDSMYERPFTAQEMIYQPDLDIITVDFAYDDNFFYFTIHLYGKNPDEWGLNGMYGIEFDRELTGRGDLLVWAEDIQADWSVQNVAVYKDQNGDVGGPQPIIADPGFNGSGYDTVVDMAGDQVAFARIAPDDPEAVQIAVSRALLDNPTQFLWGAWADNGLKDVTGFDYNDTMGPSAAGSPINTDDDYPLNELYNLDNTCRLPYGLEQMGASYQGMCITQPPANEAGPNCYRVCTGGIAALICHIECN